MTNVFKDKKKLTIAHRLFAIGEQALEKDGYVVSRMPGSGKSSMRKITKGPISKTVSIKTTQNQWFAFPRTKGDKGWLTLEDVDLVVVVSVDGKHEKAIVHLFEAKDVRERFDRAYRARKAAGHSIPIGRGVWISLYTEERDEPPTLVGAGLGLDKESVIDRQPIEITEVDPPEPDEESEDAPNVGPLTIAEAKRRLALTFGVDASAIKITVEG